MKEKRIIQDFTEGSIPRHVVLFSLPFILSNLMQVLYSLVDMLIVGHFVGSYGLAAVSTASMICTCVMVMGIGFAQGGQIYISQLVGAGKQHEIGQTVGSLCMVEFTLGVALGLVLIFPRNTLLRLLNTPAEAFVMARQYLFICGAGTVLTFIYNMISAILRGMGDSRHPMWFIAVASVVNLLLDLLFTGCLGWGVAGAALATVLGQAVSVATSLVFLWRRRWEFDFAFTREGLWPTARSVHTLIRLGVPYGFQVCAVNISMLFVNGMVNSVGVYASAVFGVGLKLDDIATKAGQGLMFALSTIVGQNFARGEMGRVRQAVWYTWLCAGVISLVYGLALLFCNRQMFGWFTDDPNVIVLAPVFASALIWNMPALALMRGGNGLIRGVGNAPLTLVFSLLDAFVFRVGLCFLLGRVLRLGLYGFLLGYGLGTYGTAIPSTIYFLSGVWERRKSLAEE